MPEKPRERILFVTGKLAEPSLRRVLNELQAKVEFDVEVAVMPITVAALMTADWIARHLPAIENIDRWSSYIRPTAFPFVLAAVLDWTVDHGRVQNVRDVRHETWLTTA